MPDNPSPLKATVADLLRSGEFSKAEELLIGAGAQTTTNPEIARLLLDTYTVLCKWKEAYQLANYITDIGGETFTSSLHRALALGKLGEKEDAVEKLKLIDFDALNIHEKQFWFLVCLELDQVLDALEPAKGCIDELSNNSLALLVTKASKSGYPKYAILFGEKFIANGGEGLGVRQQLFNCEIILGNAEKAREHLSFISDDIHAKGNESLAIDLKRIDSASCVFVHIPKTGGTTTVAAIDDIGGISLGHRALYSGNAPPPSKYYDFYEPPFVDIALLSGKTTVINIRNIYALLVSYYFDARRKYTFDFLVADSVAACKYEFPDFVRYLSEKEYGWICRDLIHFPCFAQPSGDLAVSWVNRLEQLENDMHDLGRKLGISKKVTVGHSNKNVKDDHREYYDDATIQRVSEAWADDIRLFGFNFDGTYSDGAILHQDVTQWHGRVRYSLSERKLVVES